MGLASGLKAWLLERYNLCVLSSVTPNRPARVVAHDLSLDSRALLGGLGDWSELCRRLSTLVQECRRANGGANFDVYHMAIDEDVNVPSCKEETRRKRARRSEPLNEAEMRTFSIGSGTVPFESDRVMATRAAVGLPGPESATLIARYAPKITRAVGTPQNEFDVVRLNLGSEHVRLGGPVISGRLHQD